MYPSAEALQRPEVQEFIQFAVDNYQEIAEFALTVPMDENQAAESQTAVEGAVG
jgi:hypothetical protein